MCALTMCVLTKTVLIGVWLLDCDLFLFFFQLSLSPNDKARQFNWDAEALERAGQEINLGQPQYVHFLAVEVGQ